MEHTPNTLDTLNAAGVCAAIVDDHGVVLACNALFTEAVDAVDAVGRPLSAIFGPGAARLELPADAPRAQVLPAIDGLGLIQLKRVGDVLTLVPLAEATQHLLEQQHHDSMSVLGRFAAQIAHELNNMLVVISGRGQLLQMGLPQSPRLQEDIEEILLASNRAQDFAMRLMKLRGAGRTDLKTIDLKAALQSIHKLMSRLLPPKSELTMDVGNELLRARMDPAGFERMMLCLLVGFQRHMGEGDQLHIQLRERASALTLSVSCSAPVGPPLQIYLDQALSAVGHPLPGAEISGDRQVDVHLAQQAQPQPTQPLSPWAMPAPRLKLRMLLVDDRASALEAVARMLTTLGHTTTTASDPREALALFAAHPNDFDMLVTDVLMPEMNGLELARAVQGHAAELPVLFISGYTDEVWSAHGLETLSGANVHLLHKPFNLNDFEQAIYQAYSAPTPKL